METSDLVLAGPQGCGKGTQAKVLSDNRGYRVFVAGDAVRNLAQQDTPQGREIREIMNRGDLISTETIIDCLRQFIEDTPAGIPIIFDGIPRSQEQKEQFDTLMQRLGRAYKVLCFEVPEETLLQRLHKRAGEEQRSDDVPEAIKRRLEVFGKETKPLFEQWEQTQQLVRINGNQSVEAVDSEISDKLSF